MVTVRRFALSLLNLALVFSVGNSLAKDNDISPSTRFDDGIWEIRIFKVLTNSHFPPRPITDQQCITNRDIAEGRLPLHTMRECTVVPGAFHGSKLELKISCGENSNAITKGELQFERTTFQGTVEILEKTDNGPGDGLRITYDAKRIGACDRE